VPTPEGGANETAIIGPTMPPATEEEYSPEEIKKAEEYKTNGNNFFKSKYFIFFYSCLFYLDCKFDQALDAYSEAIFCNVPPKKKAIYYCNRALVSIKTENYALALFDAKDAIKCDDTYVKAYYRKGSAELALNQYELAIVDFKTVCKMKPTDKDAREKYD